MSKELRTLLCIPKSKKSGLADAPTFDLTVYSSDKKRMATISRKDIDGIGEIRISRREWKIIKEHIDCMFNGKYKREK